MAEGDGRRGERLASRKVSPLIHVVSWYLVEKMERVETVELHGRESLAPPTVSNGRGPQLFIREQPALKQP